MLSLIALEFRKLIGTRSARLALGVCLLIPLLWMMPRLNALFNVTLVSGWQVPAVSIGVMVQFLLPLFIAITCAEMIGTEVAQGTLAPLLMRPLDRNRIIISKLVVALAYPAMLILALLAGSLVVGLRFGYGEFAGGTGLGAGGFAGVGMLSSGVAFGEIIRASFLAIIMLLPIAALALLYGVMFLNTAAAALATLATLNIFRLLVVFPEAIQRILLTSHFDLYARVPGTPGVMSIASSVFLLLVYTVGFSLMAIFAFDRRDV